MKFTHPIAVLTISLSTLLMSHVYATENISRKETDSLIKDDIANTQVLQEICPALLSNKVKFEQNISNIYAMYFADYSDKSVTLMQLQKDTEYQEMLKTARQSAKEIQTTEQRSICEDVLNFTE